MHKHVELVRFVRPQLVWIHMEYCTSCVFPFSHDTVVVNKIWKPDFFVWNCACFLGFWVLEETYNGAVTWGLFHSVHVFFLSIFRNCCNCCGFICHIWLHFGGMLWHSHRSSTHTHHTHHTQRTVQTRLLRVFLNFLDFPRAFNNHSVSMWFSTRRFSFFGFFHYIFWIFFPEAMPWRSGCSLHAQEKTQCSCTSFLIIVG